MRADARRHHYIYKITRFDGKYYLGMHSTNNLDDGYFGSGKLITRSIKKYGVEKHTKEILEFLDSRIQLKTRERELVNEEIVDDPLCMNLQLGGGGGFIDVEHQTKCSSAGGKVGGKIAGKMNVEKARAAMLATRKSFVTSGTTGKCWVTNGVKPISISREQLDEYIRNGYSKGRKLFAGVVH